MNKLLFTDIDGTLTDSKGKIPEKNIKAINRLADKGIKTVLCTGRNITKALPVAKELNINLPMVCIDGILLYDVENKRTIHDMLMEKSQAIEIIDIAEKFGVFAEASNGYKYYKHIHSKDQLKFDFFNSHTPLGRFKSYLGGIRYLNSYSELKKISGGYYQVTIGCEESIKKEIIEEIKSKGFENIDIRDNLWDGYIFINQKGADKSRGIDILCKEFGISPKETVSIGDDLNDLGMLEFCGTGVAMGNATDKVKQAADFVTLTNDENGFVLACERFFDI